MKTLKLQLTARQCQTLSDMLQYVILQPETRTRMDLEYYTLLEWYHRLSHRFLFCTCQPLPMRLAEACALYRVAATCAFPIPGAGGVATAILAQFSPKFSTGGFETRPNKLKTRPNKLNPPQQIKN